MRKAHRQLQDMVLLWTVAWAVIGLALGIAQLLRTGQISWIPGLGLGGAAGGLGIGILYAGLMVLTEDWRDSLADTPGIVAQLGPQVLCGAGAGLIPGLLVGGISGALFFATLGACSAAVFNWRAAQEAMLARAARSKLRKAKSK
jgi:hypothetical protein